MLVLSRKLGEQIHIGNGVTLTVVEITGRKIRLGITAPQSVPIVRDELLGTPPTSAETGPKSSASSRESMHRACKHS